ncbi:MAG TPA: type III secretion system cytoplasmic ring protein SctQ [Bordetella sp.]|nr:type III secretion system cytoplasmic ring protein SctQ [Bordetella sp.]
MTTPGPLRLVPWTSAQARILTIIARHADTVVVPEFGDGADAKPWNIRMRPLLSKDAPWTHCHPFHGENTKDDVGRLVAFDWDGARLSLRLSSRVCDDWLAVRMPDLEIAPLPSQFIDAAWDAMIHEAMRALGVTRLCPGMRVLADAGAEYPYAWTLSIRSPDTARAITAVLAVDETGLQRLGDVLSSMPVGDGGGESGILDTLPVSVVAQAGETALDAADVRRMEIGDVVLLDRCLASLDGDVWLTTSDGQGVRVRACEPAASRYVVIQEWSSLRMNDYPPHENHYASEQNHYATDENGYPMAEDGFPAAEHACRSGQDDYPPRQDAPLPAAGAEWAGADGPPVAVREPGPPAGDEGPDVDRIPVRLVFDLGEQSMPLGELRRLRPGEFFDLQRRIDAGPVHIRANGTLIGTAELVDIDGRIGARVLTLFPGRG